MEEPSLYKAIAWAEYQGGGGTLCRTLSDIPSICNFRMNPAFVTPTGVV